MKPAALHRLPPLVTSLALLMGSVTAGAESRLTSTEPNASASLNFRVIIPAVMRVLENSHPQQLSLDADGGSLGGEQRLVVLSNMKHGFCVSLRLAASGMSGWQLQAAPEPGVSLHATTDGYRLCAARPGRYQLVLQHRFTAPEKGLSATPGWPVATDITAI